jgi:prepilin-type N-terminal cleavage/methylation domain-containing protein
LHSTERDTNLHGLVGGSGRRSKRQSGVSLMEIIVVIVVIGVMSTASVSYMRTWQEDQQAASVARSLADMLALARAEAMRTGSNQLLLFNIGGVSTQDAAGNDIEDVTGVPATAVVVTDRFGGVENCALDDGDIRTSLAANDNFRWGVTNANLRAPLDGNQPAIGLGSTFARVAAPNTPLNGLIFGPQGIPFTFSANGTGCLAIDSVGSGGGALYITNGRRDYAVVQSPLGGTRFHVWDASFGTWSQ